MAKLIQTSLTALILCAGCAPHVKIERQRMFLAKDHTPEPTLFTAYYDSSYRGSIIYIDEDQKLHLISDAQPDTALSTAAEISGKIDYQKLGASGTAKLAQAVLKNGEVTASVKIIRDLLSRYEILISNNGSNLTGEQLQLFKEIVDGGLKIALESVKGSQAGAADTSKETAELMKLFEKAESDPAAKQQLKKKIDEMVTKPMTLPSSQRDSAAP